MTTLPQALTRPNCGEQVRRADVVVDGCDNRQLGWRSMPLAVAGAAGHGAAIRLEGAGLAAGREGARYRCLYRDADGPETCAQTGVLAPVVGIVGSIQALEAIKVLTDFGRRRRSVVAVGCQTDGMADAEGTSRSGCPVCGGGAATADD